MNRRPRIRTRGPLYRLACRTCRGLGPATPEGPPSTQALTQALGQWTDYVSEAQRMLSITRRRITLARDRGWHLAAAKLHEDLFFQAQRLHGGVEQLLALRSQRNPTPPPSVALVLEELVQLQQEFERVDLRPREGRIRALTEPLVLEGVDLGRFAIAEEYARNVHPAAAAWPSAKAADATGDGASGADAWGADAWGADPDGDPAMDWSDLEEGTDLGADFGPAAGAWTEKEGPIGWAPGGAEAGGEVPA